MMPAAPRDGLGTRRDGAPTAHTDRATTYGSVRAGAGDVEYVTPYPRRLSSQRPSQSPGGSNDVVAGALARLRQGVDAAALDRRLLVDPSAMSSSVLTAQEAYLISRIDYDINVELLLDMSPLGREQTLRLLEGLARQGLIRFET